MMADGSFEDFIKNPEAPPADQAPSPTGGQIAADVGSEGLKGALRGVGQFAGDMGEAVMGPFGPRHSLARLGYDLGLTKNEPPQDPTYGQQIAKSAGIEPSPETPQGKFAGTMGEFMGNPTSYFGPGGFLSKMLMSGASGAGSEALGEAAEGSKFEPLARTAGSLVAPTLARGAKPQLAPDQQMLASAGVNMTPGQLAGGVLKDLEGAASSIPILGSFMKKGRQNSIESFNKAVGNQALAPIGEKLDRLTPAGHPLVEQVEEKLGNAYDNLLPKLNWTPDVQYAVDLHQIEQNAAATLAAPVHDHFQKIVDHYLGPPRTMNGDDFKGVESQLNYFASRYGSSPNPADRELGSSVRQVVRAMRENLERSNPDHSAELKDINSGWAMFSRIRDAAQNRATSGGTFTPSDLLGAIKKGDTSPKNGSFARGDALMQNFGEAGQKVLPNTIANSGTAERGALMAGLASGSYFLHSPHIAAGVGAGILPYTKPGMAGVTQYARPTTGLRASIASRGRGMGSVAPVIEAPFGPSGQSPYKYGGSIKRTFSRLKKDG